MGEGKSAQSNSRSLAVIAVAATLAASWAAACSSFGGDESVDPSPEAGVPSEGGTPPVDAGSGDVVAPDVVAPRLACDAGPLVLCDDFEGELGALWTKKSIVLPGALELLVATAPAASQVLRVSVAGDAGTGSATLSHAFVLVDLRGLTCDFDLTPQGLPSPPGARPKLFTFSVAKSATSEASGLFGYVSLDAQGSYLVTQASDLDGGFVSGPESDKAAFPATGASHLSFDLDLDAGKFSMSLNGLPLHSISLAGTMKKNNGVNISLGLDSIARPVAYDIDNVVCAAR